MNFFNQMGKGINSYSKALDFIRKHRLSHLFFLPAIFNFIAFLLTAWLAWQYSGDFVSYLREQSGLTEPETMLWRVVQFILAIIIRLIMLLLYLKMYRYIILILFAPLLAYVSEKVQEILSGENTSFSLSRLINDSLRGMAIAFRNFLLEIAVTIAIIVAGFIVSIASPLIPVLIFLVESYFYGFSMIDYRNEYVGMSFRESNKFIWEHKGLALSNGIVFNFLLLIPVLGVLFAPTLALTAAILSVDPSNLNPKKYDFEKH